MKNTKLIAATAIATVMASSAYAELSLGGAFATVHNTGDGNKGMTILLLHQLLTWTTLLLLLMAWVLLLLLT
jgi:hypothetical protein